MSKVQLNFHLFMALSELSDAVQLLERIASGELKPDTHEFNGAMLAYLTERCFDSESCEDFVTTMQINMLKRASS